MGVTKKQNSQKHPDFIGFFHRDGVGEDVKKTNRAKGFINEGGSNLRLLIKGFIKGIKGMYSQTSDP